MASEMPCAHGVCSCFSFLKQQSSKTEAVKVNRMQRRFRELQRNCEDVVILRGGEGFDVYFNKVEKVGEGTFGHVWKGTFTKKGLQALPALEAGRTYIAKQIYRPKLDREMEEIECSFLQLPSTRHLEFLRTISSQQCADHHIIRRFGEFLEGGAIRSLYCIVENLAGSDMMDWLATCDHTVAEPQAAELVRQMLNALHFLHRTAGALHRDIKFENFGFPRPVTPNAPMPPLRLFDFGVAWVLPEPVTADTALTLYKLSTRGTLLWLAPETFRGRCGAPSDIWGAGIALYSMLTFTWPFGLDEFMECSADDCKGLAKAINTRNLDFGTAAGGHLSEAAREFVAGLLAKNPARRMTTDQALDDPWLRFPGEDTPTPTPIRKLSSATPRAERDDRIHWGMLATARLAATVDLNSPS